MTFEVNIFPHAQKVVNLLTISYLTPTMGSATPISSKTRLLFFRPTLFLARFGDFFSLLLRSLDLISTSGLKCDFRF